MSVTKTPFTIRKEVIGTYIDFFVISIIREILRIFNYSNKIQNIKIEEFRAR